jgi:hypothetical protein
MKGFQKAREIVTLVIVTGILRKFYSTLQLLKINPHFPRLKRTADMECGTDSTPLDGTACVGGPGSDSQHVCGQCGVLFDVSYPLGAHMMNP